jgi:hypothetical protein
MGQFTWDLGISQKYCPLQITMKAESSQLCTRTNAYFREILRFRDVLLSSEIWNAEKSSFWECEMTSASLLPCWTGLDWTELWLRRSLFFYCSVVFSMQDFFLVMTFDENQMFHGWKLDGVGPVDNRPSTNKLHHFVHKKKCDMWHMTCDMWHVTRDMWHMTCDMLRGWTFSQNFSPLALMVCDLWYLEDWDIGRLTWLINDKGVCTLTLKKLLVFFWNPSLNWQHVRKKFIFWVANFNFVPIFMTEKGCKWLDLLKVT